MTTPINLREDTSFANSEYGASIVESAELARRASSRVKIPYEWLKEVFLAHGVSLTTRRKRDKGNYCAQKERAVVRRGERHYGKLDVQIKEGRMTTSADNARKALQVLGLI